ncbi:hypothetical protein LUR56_12400 [Streptomyces sp. MT29]|nr:hypothetical protein [Streptomyces sp. MT29]
MNRVLLGTVGLALLGGGALLAVGDGSGLGRVGREVPAWWSGRAADGVLLDREGLARVRETGWWTPAVIAGSSSYWRCSFGGSPGRCRGPGPGGWVWWAPV